MSKASKIILFSILFCLCVTISSYATVLWYNGDFDGRNAWPNGYQTRFNSRMYDDFIVPAGGWTVNSAWSNNLMWFHWVTDTGHYYTVEEAYWEIRSGITGGWMGGGQLIAGGFESPATQTPTGRIGWGNPLEVEYTIKANFDDIFLPEGRYWLSVAPVGKYPGYGYTYITSTSDFYGTDWNNPVGRPGGDNAYFFLASGNYYWPLWPQVPENQGDGYSMGLGYEPHDPGPNVPEPATLSLLGLGLLGILGFKKRRL